MHYCDHPGLKKDRAAQTAYDSSKGVWFREGVERERGFEPPAACLEGISL
jgi:hypothetical protein